MSITFVEGNIGAGKSSLLAELAVRGYSCLSTRSENTVGLTAGSCKLAAPKKLLWRAPVGTKHQIGSNRSLKLGVIFGPFWRS